MVRMMPSYTDKDLPETEDVYKDLEKSLAIGQKYASYLKAAKIGGDDTVE